MIVRQITRSFDRSSRSSQNIWGSGRISNGRTSSRRRKIRCQGWRKGAIRFQRWIKRRVRFQRGGNIVEEEDGNVTRHGKSESVKLVELGELKESKGED